jgi:prevent-host-death family protein
MEFTNIHDAKTELSKLIERVEGGEEIIIARAGLPVAKLVPYRADEEPRTGGQWRGRVRIAEDFDELPADLAAAFGIAPG